MALDPALLAPDGPPVAVSVVVAAPVPPDVALALVMVAAALRCTLPGSTVTPAQIVTMIGAPIESIPFVCALAASDILAVATPFHRLQEADGTGTFYRWGEARRQALLQREASSLTN